MRTTARAWTEAEANPGTVPKRTQVRHAKQSKVEWGVQIKFLMHNILTYPYSDWEGNKRRLFGRIHYESSIIRAYHEQHLSQVDTFGHRSSNSEKLLGALA